MNFASIFYKGKAKETIYYIQSRVNLPKDKKMSPICVFSYFLASKFTVCSTSGNRTLVPKVTNECKLAAVPRATLGVVSGL